MERSRTTITWSVHLDAPPEEAYEFLTTDAGRERFWAESTTASDGMIAFRFPSGTTYHSEVIADEPPDRFILEYFGAPATFELSEDGHGGTRLTLTHREVAEPAPCEMHAGWVSVLLALKATVNFSVDLRNHDPDYTWAAGYVGN